MQSKESIMKFLYSNADEEYKNFTKKLIPGTFDIIGVRIPVLKSTVKKMTEEEISFLLDMENSDIFEVNMLKALAVAYIKDIETYKYYFKKFYPYIDNWSICDTFLSASKIIKKDKDYFFNKAKELLKSRDEFQNRIAFVLLLDYYVEEDYIEEIFTLLDNYRSDKYYANMALAWLISVMYIKFPLETKTFLLNSNLDRDVIKMSIRKIKDSYRVDEENKEWLKKLAKRFS